MGVDGWVLPEIKHGEEAFRPLHMTKEPYKMPRSEAMFALIGDVTNNKGRFPASDVAESTFEGRTIPAFRYAPDEGSHDPIEPICEPTGVPLDSSLMWLDFVESMRKLRGDSIVTTCLSLRQIIEANWDQKINRVALVTEEDYIEYLNNGTLPTMWAASAGGTIVNELEYQQGKRGDKSTMVRMGWSPGTIRDESNGFVEMLRDIDNARPERSQLRFQFLFEA